MDVPLPSMDELVKKVDTRYTMVIIAAKRARQILEGSRPLAGTVKDKPVTAALKELAVGQLRWEQRKSGVK
ncbi:MAG: DNA-directed RNA polymerase subunit omega [Clostridia bacterium]|nr:DNA-directed RNA polymerase subunit omega [Clostridia bacterium]